MLSIPETQIFKDFINKAQENLENEVGRLRVPPPGGSQIQTFTSICNKSRKIEIKKSDGDKYVYFDCIEIADFDTESITDYKKRSEQSKQSTVFYEFNKIMLDLGRKLSSKEDVDFSREHTKIFIKYLTGDLNFSDHFLDRIPGFRIDTVYLFDEKNGVIALYPPTKDGVFDSERKLDYRERPWYKSSMSQYETVYLPENSPGNTSGLTGIFIDITDTRTPNAIRTLWYRFKDTKENQYILAFDMFLDKTDNSFLSFFLLSTPFEWMMLVLIALPSSLILSLLYEELVKRLRNTNSFNNLSGIRFTLIKEYYATLNDQSISFNDTNVMISRSSVQTSVGVTLSLQGAGMEGKIERTAQQNRQEEKAYSYSFDHQYSLKVGPVRPTHKAVQIWQAEREPHQGKSQIVGHVVADWKTNNTVSSSGELSIKSIFWNKKEEVYFPSFQRQLRDHLLTGETGELTLVPDTQYQKRQSIPALLSDIDPDKLETVPELKQVIDNSFDLDQGRFFVSQLETVETLYALGHVKAIYSIPFVRKIIKKGQHDFFRTTAMDTDKEEFRFVLEHEPHHFKNRVYNHLNPDIQDDWKNESPFQIMVHQRSNTENVILEQEGFSLIYINNVLRFVLYSLSDDTYSGIGWVSWRKVDLEFFKTLYDYQRSKGNSLKTVKSYIES
ncbi:MAG: hypothetical protein F6K18_10125 [Okeania sp. SIO2C2]|uniref:hypothetical protein n=1 Tax=Okeania sp. SIO2C2 TaxID=2607787 RepID=UPI0013B5EA3D|nr:hypothetical protein [Okeania sp. SIO2C2]NEP87156.1 hypothetical protein [Okeania sp. SIO2C2]